MHNFTYMCIQLIHTFDFPLNFDFFNSIQEEKSDVDLETQVHCSFESPTKKYHPNS
jgi:hypothetical protein